MVEKILNNTTPYGEIRASHEGSLHSSTLSGIMTSKLLIRESELPRPTATSILISRMKSSSVIIPYVIKGTGGGI